MPRRCGLILNSRWHGRRLAVARSQLYFNGIDLERNTGAAVRERRGPCDLAPARAGEAGSPRAFIATESCAISKARSGRYEEALRRLPNSAFVLEQMAHLERRLGQV